MTKATAKLSNLKVAPRKVRLVSNVIKGRAVNEALAELQMIPSRSAPDILKLLKSAVANARGRNMNVDKLVIESITVDQGPMLKRYLPRAMGRATPIHKKMSHVTLTLGERESVKPKYTIYEAPKKIKSGKKVKEEKPKFHEEKVVGKVVKPGFFQKLFRRKTI